MNPMDSSESSRAFQKAMRGTQVLLPPRQSLFTFSPTDIRYFMVTELLDNARVELRKGKLTVERPGILTPNIMFEQWFEGFDAEQRGHLEAMLQSGGFRGLQYKYKNETESVELHAEKFQAMADRVILEARSRPLARMTVIRGVPELWSLSLMKCAFELSSQSFPSNIKDLEEHGWLS